MQKSITIPTFAQMLLNGVGGLYKCVRADQQNASIRVHIPAMANFCICGQAKKGMVVPSFGGFHPITYPCTLEAAARYT